VRVRPEAELDLVIAASWYSSQRPGLGAEFLDELDSLVASLGENALLYAEILDGVRRAFAHRFPYAVTYRIVDQDVVVLSVLHMRRKGSP
jgi:plasmid stabilization system protein ParE